MTDSLEQQVLSERVKEIQLTCPAYDVGHKLCFQTGNICPWYELQARKITPCEIQAIYIEKGFD